MFIHFLNSQPSYIKRKNIIKKQELEIKFGTVVGSAVLVCYVEELLFSWFFS